MVESDESTVRIVLRLILAPIVLGAVIGFVAQAVLPWEVIAAIVVVGTPIYVIRELRWVSRQKAEAKRRLEEFVAFYDRRPRT